MAVERINSLIYAVRGRVVAKYCGQLALMLAVLTLVPLAFAVTEAAWLLVQRYLVLCTGLLLLGGWLARLPAPPRIQVNEALTITALAFISSPLLMSWPMMGTNVPFVDALFEAVSGVTTTGLSTLGSVENRPDTFLFARAWMQWYGGLGIIVLSVALLMGHQVVARRLVSPLDSGETLAATARSHARRSLIVYLTLTVLGVALLWSLTGEGFTAVLHVLAAVSTGGFSSYDSSLAGFGSSAASIAIMALSFLGAVSFPLYWYLLQGNGRGRLRALLTDIELRALVIGCLLVGGLLVWLGALFGSETPWYHGFMMGVSAQTTAGFATTSVVEMNPAAQVVMIVSMLIGGSVGSSAGGFKLLRLLILLRLLQLLIQRASMPVHAVAEPYLGGHKLEDDDLIRALQLILLFVLIIILSWLPFVIMGYEPLAALFEVVSACGTVGLSSGIARPELETFLKGILCFDMIAGRVEIVALLVVLYPRNWFGRKEDTV